MAPARWWPRRTALVLPFLLLAAACAPAGPGREIPPPEVRLVDLRLVQPGLLEQELLVRLRLVNLADVPLDVRGMRFRLLVEDRLLGRGVIDRKLRVPPLASREVQGRLYVSTAALVERVLAAVERGGLRYRLEGELFLGRRSGTRTLPFESEAELLPLRPALRE